MNSLKLINNLLEDVKCYANKNPNLMSKTHSGIIEHIARYVFNKLMYDPKYNTQVNATKLSKQQRIQNLEEKQEEFAVKFKTLEDRLIAICEGSNDYSVTTIFEDSMNRKYEQKISFRIGDLVAIKNLTNYFFNKPEFPIGKTVLRIRNIKHESLSPSGLEIETDLGTYCAYELELIKKNESKTIEEKTVYDKIRPKDFKRGAIVSDDHGNLNIVLQVLDRGNFECIDFNGEMHQWSVSCHKVIASSMNEYLKLI